jgi:hypothetical protein
LEEIRLNKREKIMRISKTVLVSALALNMAMASPAFALTAAQCEQIASVATGVYDQSIKNGETPAVAAGRAQRTFMRRIAGEGGTAPSTMVDDINDCKSAGLSIRNTCNAIASFFTSSPC